VLDGLIFFNKYIQLRLSSLSSPTPVNKIETVARREQNLALHKQLQESQQPEDENRRSIVNKKTVFVCQTNLGHIKGIWTLKLAQSNDDVSEIIPLCCRSMNRQGIFLIEIKILNINTLIVVPPHLLANAVVMKQEPIEMDNDEEVANYSLKISPEEAVQVKLEEVMIDWPFNKNDDDDGNSN
jgi:hypothetical protein